MTAGASTISGAGLARRAMGAFLGGLLLLGVVVLVATTAVAAWPRFASTLLTDDLQYQVGQTQAVNRDLVTLVVTGGDLSGMPQSAAATWKAMPGALQSVRNGMKPDLRAVTAPGDYSARSDTIGIEPPAGAASNSRYGAILEAYGSLRDVSVLDTGAWPAPAPPTIRQGSVIEVVLSTAAAGELGWKVGESRGSSLGEDPISLKLVGTVHPKSAGADFWALDTERAHGLFADHGDGGKEYQGIAWVDPGSWPAIAPTIGSAMTAGWFPVRPSAFSVDRIDAVKGDLNNFLASAPSVSIDSVVTPLRFSTALDRTLDEFLTQAQPANTLFAILAAGPLGVAIAVLVLGVRLVLGRRRDALALMAARGGSPGRLRWGLALEGAVVSVPAAALGLAAALALTPRGGPVTVSIVAAVLCALTPPLVLAVAAGSLGPRDDLRGERAARRRWGWVVELIVVGLAVLGVVALFQRGIAPRDAGLGVDPLLAVTPILIALAACLVVLRIYAVPLGWLALSFRRRPGAVAYIGSTSAVRSRAGGLWPVFALVVGVSITVFSVSILSTERAGIEDGARARVGADLSVSAASTFTDQQVAQLQKVAGVAHTAVVEWAGGLQIQAGTIGGDLSGYLVDPKQLAVVEADLPERARISTALTSVIPGRTGAVIGGWSSQIPITSAILYAQTNVHLAVTEFDYKPGVYLWDAEWAIIDKTTLPADAGVTGKPNTVLIALAPGADAAKVHAALERIAGDGAKIGDAIQEQKTLRQAPLVSGLETIALISIALAALMCIGALLLTLVMNTASRTRLVATLRTIGFTSRQTAGLVGWELGPILVVGLIAGILVGLALPPIVLAPVDLSGFTGGPIAPDIVIDPVLVAVAAGAFALVTALATLIALAGARRRSPAAVLRAGGEE